MTAHKKIFLDETMFQSFITTGTNTNVIVTTALPYVAVPTGLVEGKVSMSLQGVEMTEVAYSAVDVLLNVGKFAMNVNSTANFIVDKILVDTEEKAINYLIGILAQYEMMTLAYNDTSPNLYTIETVTADGIVVSNTNASSLSDLITRIEVLDRNLNINTVGYYTHKVVHSLTIPS